MAKGKDIVADNEHDHTFDEDINLEDGYHDDLMANNADLEDEKNKANLDGADLNGIELDSADFDGAYLDGVYLDGANFYSLNVHVLNSSDSKRGVNMGAR